MSILSRNTKDRIVISLTSEKAGLELINAVESMGGSGVISVNGMTGVVTISPFNSTDQGLVPASGGGTANFLRADGTWTTPPTTSGGITSLIGDVTTDDSGEATAKVVGIQGSPVSSIVPTAGDYLAYNGVGASWDLVKIGGDVVIDETGNAAIQSAVINAANVATNGLLDTNMPQMAANTLKGNNTSGTANQANLTVSQVQTMLGYITSLHGDVTASGPGAASTMVVSVGGASAASIESAVLVVNNATANDSASTLVYRDGSGNFSAGTITASLIGTASGNANIALSNLTTTAINESLIPSSSLNLGSATSFWNNAFITSLSDSSGEVSVAVPQRQLLDTAGNTQFSWSTSGIVLGGGLAVDGVLSFGNAHDNNLVNVRAPASLTASYNFALPTTAGTAGQVLTSAAGSSSMTWTTATSSPTTSTLMIRDTSGNVQANLIGLTGGSSFDFTSGVLTDISGNNSVELNSHILIAENQSVDWGNRILCDTSGRNAVQWGSGNLVVDNGSGVNQPEIAQSWFNQSGTTVSRPATTSLLTGYFFFDTTLNKPIWWSGTSWVDATGTTV